MRQAVLGLGSNCGERLRFLRKAISRLRSLGSLGSRGEQIEITAISPLYESDALLPDDAPSDWALPFLNLALLCNTPFSPGALLREVKSLEQELGRKPRGRWAPREIDIDILAIDGESFKSPELTVPHPELARRPFALLPLLDLAPHWLPELHEAATAWIARNPTDIPFHTRRSLTPLCEIVGIVNATPDSFSDGGIFFSENAAIAHGERLIQDGATVLDIGGESTRPGATAVTVNEEWRRIFPILRGLRGRGALLSVDTRHAETAKRALDSGADWINDVSGFSDPRMVDAVREWQCELVAMHSVSVPADPKKHLPLGTDPAESIIRWSTSLLQGLAEAGIASSRLILDPGVGFGKTAQQNIRILEATREIRKHVPRLLIGHSRKSFISAWKNDEAASDRDLETAALSVHLAKNGADYLRVHDVRSTIRALQAWIQVDGRVILG